MVRVSVCSTDTQTIISAHQPMSGRCEQSPVGGIGVNPIKPIRRVRTRFPETWATVSLVSRTTGCGNDFGGAWAPRPVIPVMPHAAVRASTAGMGAGIRHKRPDRSWTARAYPCGLLAQRFRSPTGRGDSLRNCPVRVRIPAKAPAETRASTPPMQVLKSCLFRERCIMRPSHNWGR